MSKKIRCGYGKPACAHAQARPGIAFVEFENEAQAATSMQSLQNFKITPTNAIGISYAKQ